MGHRDRRIDGSDHCRKSPFYHGCRSKRQRDGCVAQRWKNHSLGAGWRLPWRGGCQMGFAGQDIHRRFFCDSGCHRDCNWTNWLPVVRVLFWNPHKPKLGHLVRHSSRRRNSIETSCASLRNDLSRFVCNDRVGIHAQVGESEKSPFQFGILDAWKLDADLLGRIRLVSILQRIRSARKKNRWRAYFLSVERDRDRSRIRRLTDLAIDSRWRHTTCESASTNDSNRLNDNGFRWNVAH